MKHASLVLVALSVAACGSTPTAATPPPAPITAQSLTVTGQTNFGSRDETGQLIATLTLSNGTTQDQTRAATWSSSDPSIASVSATGLVRALRSGTATIQATFSGFTGTKAIGITIACEVNNTAQVRFWNQSPATTQLIQWNGVGLFTVAPNETSAYVTMAAGVPQTIRFFVAGSGRLACSDSTPVFAQCSTQTMVCDGP